MFCSPLQFLVTLQLLIHAVFANSIVVRKSLVTLPLSRRLNLTSVHNLLRRDQARAKGLRARAVGKINQGNLNFSVDDIVNEPIDNQAVTYIASVGVGSPATTYSLLVDTGSSNTWVGAGRAYVRTATSVQTTNRVSVNYGFGALFGTEFTDTVTLAPGLVIQAQSIGVASTASGFEGTDGILGLGPVDLTLGTLSPATGSTVPTVMDNLFSQGIIPSDLISISFEPTTTDEVLNGEITWGGGDSSRLIGTVAFQTLTATEPASEFWGIDQQIRYGASTPIQSHSAGIVDTGTTLILIASDAFFRYRAATGAALDATTGLLRITTGQFANLKSLFFIMNCATLELTANAQLWPRSLNTAIGGTAGNIYLIIGDIGTPTGEGFDFINGFAFLERFYSVFDTTNQLIGFANTTFTSATTN